MIFFSSHNVWNFWKSIIDPLFSISSKIRTIMISVIIGVFAFLYFVNGLLTLAISSDKRHLDVIFVNDVLYFDCSVCYCILNLNRYPFFRSYKYYWFSGTGLRFLKSSFFFLYLSMPIVAQRCSSKKVFLEISQNAQENTCAGISFLIKLQAPGLQLY